MKYLGVHLDQTLCLEHHISAVCRSAYFSLRQISSIRPYLSEASTARLVCATVTSKLDYCNSVLVGLPAEQIYRLQRVQNDAARLICKKRKRDHITPILVQLHWLPIQQRVEFKLASLAFRGFHDSLPKSLSDKLKKYVQGHPISFRKPL